MKPLGLGRGQTAALIVAVAGLGFGMLAWFGASQESTEERVARLTGLDSVACEQADSMFRCTAGSSSEVVLERCSVNPGAVIATARLTPWTAASQTPGCPTFAMLSGTTSSGAWRRSSIRRASRSRQPTPPCARSASSA